MSSTTRVQFNVPDSKLAELDEMQNRLGLSTRKDLFDTAMALLKWAIREKEKGRTIVAADEEEPQRELVMHALENISGEKALFEKRLFKVAKELKVSTEQVEEFLEDQGYDDALKGSGFNATIVDEVAYLALRQEFDGDTESASRSNSDGTVEQLDEASENLLDHLEDPHLSLRNEAVDRYLGILSKVFQQKPNRFEEVEEEITGDTRKYFGEDAKELASSGTGVNPKQIPSTPYYAATGNDTKTKRDRAEKVLRLLDYDERVIQKARNVI
jgi:negative regulator of replication initiation